MKSSFKRKDDILELVHIDLYGLIGVKSYCREKYFILFIDEYSRMMIVMFLKEKIDVFQLFKWNLARVKKEMG